MNNYLVEETRSGFKTLIYKDPAGKRDIRLHSAYDPVKEAERSVTGFNKGRASIVLVTGLALGYHVQLLSDNYKDCEIIVLERDPEVIELCRLTNPGVFKKADVVTSQEEIENFFARVDVVSFKGIASYIHKPSYQIDPQFYDGITAGISRFLSSRVSDLLTRFEFEEKWIKNIFKNLKHLSSAEGFERFFGAFKGYPGIIVSAGPSLKNNIKELAGMRDRSVIVAVDTAFKVLSRYDIQPHFAVTLDAQKYSLKHFLGVPEKETVLVADIVSCPAILNLYKGPRVISTTSKYYTDSHGTTCRETTPVMDWVEKYTGFFGDIQSGGSVATTVFDMLLNFGCDPIILVGQDLAYTGREIHCTGTYHNDDWIPGINRLKNLECINQNVVRKRKIKYVPGFGAQKPVITDFVFDLYKSWFEDSASRVSVKVINSTEGGASIKNTIEMELNRNSFPENPGRNPEEIIKDIFSKTKGIPSGTLINGLRECTRQIDDIIVMLESDNVLDSYEKKVMNMVESDTLSPLFTPLLRKINIYLTRKDLDPEKRKEILLEEVRSSALKLKTFINGSDLI